MNFAQQVSTTGGPEVLEWIPTTVNEPGSGEVVIDVHAAGVNFIDTYHRSGLYPMPLPFVPGSEGSGTVAGVGSDVASVKVGDRVAWVGVAGSYATRIAAPASSLMAVPDGVSLDIAAALPLQGMTAHYLVSDTYRLGTTDRCLINAAAGGTGRLMVQMAKLAGAEVVATVGSASKVELARSAGADHVINYNEVEMVAGIEAAVGTDAIDVVYDGVGAATFDAGLMVLRPRGTMVTFGNASGPVPPFSPLQLMAKSLYVTRPKLWDYISSPGDRDARWTQLCDWVSAGQLDVRIGHTYAMSDAGQAHVALESRATTGKLLLTA